MKAAAQILAFYFLLGSLFPGTDFSQLSKLGKLLEHFELHQQEAAATSETLAFSTFLLDHFWGQHRHDHHDDSHQELPLQSIQHFPLVLPAHHPVLASGPEQPVAALVIAIKEVRPSGFCGAVFRPPVLS